MKKVLLSLLAVAALVLSCQNYDDEFAALNSKVASLESQISSLAGLQTALTQVQSSVTALQAAVSAIPNLSSEVAAILADLSDLETAVSGATTSADLDALKAELNTTLAALQALIEANSSDIASVVAANAGLKTQLEALGVDVNAVLAQNSTYTGNLSITNAAELAFAKSLGDKVKVINGNVNIVLSSSNGLKAADVDAVSALIQTVVGNVTITTNASIDLSALTSISGDYVVDGKDVADDALVSAGDILLDYDGGYVMPALTTAKKIYLVDYDTNATATTPVVGTLIVDFVSLTSATAVTTVGAGSVHTSGGGVHSSGGSINVSTFTLNNVDFTDATSIKIGDAPVVKVNAPDATSLELHYDGAKTAQLSSLEVDGAKLTSVTIMATYIAGALDIDGAATAAFSAPKLLEVAGATTIDSATLSLPVATKLTGAVSLANATSLSLPAATSTGAITAEKVATLTAPKLVNPSIDIEETSTIELASILTGGFADAADLANVTSVKLNALTGVLNLSTAEDLVTADVIGLSNASEITFSGVTTNDKLANLTLGGKLGTVTIGTNGSDGLAKLVSFSTTGTIQTLVVQNAEALTSMTLDHTEDAANGANLTIRNNDKLTSFTTNIDRVLTFVVTGNETLSSFDASSIQTIPTNAVTGTVTGTFNYTVSGNIKVPTVVADQVKIASYKGLIGSYVALSATTAETHKQNSLNTLRPFLRALDAAKTGSSATLAETDYTISLQYYHDATSGGTAAVSSKTISDIDDTEKISAE